MDITLWIEVALFIVLMGFSAFISSSETSLFSLNKIQPEQMRRHDDPNLNLIERLLSQPRRQIADAVTTMIIGKQRTRSNIVTKDMVRTLARDAVGEGGLAPAEAGYIDHIFDFGNKTVVELMAPGSNIFFQPLDLPFADMVQELPGTGHRGSPGALAGCMASNE